VTQENREEPTMSTAEEPVTTPDQRKPGHRIAAYLGALVCAAVLLAMSGVNDPNGVERAWLYGITAVLLLALVVDWQLRRSGVRR
jgi:peptidoglycan/LPS O-acetylase OafA/YrhL